jgi:uncharacterized protein (DUF2384 family)
MRPPDVIDGLSALDIARVCHVQSEVAQAWLDGTESPTNAELARLRLVNRVMDALAANGLGDPEDRVEWLRNPNRAFGREAPIDLLARDESQPVLDYIDRLS